MVRMKSLLYVVCHNQNTRCDRDLCKTGPSHATRCRTWFDKPLMTYSEISREGLLNMRACTAAAETCIRAVCVDRGHTFTEKRKRRYDQAFCKLEDERKLSLRPRSPHGNAQQIHITCCNTLEGAR